MLPHFYIIGAQKAGSTYLLHCLADHPKIFMPPHEVPLLEGPEHGGASLESLARQFELALPGQTVGAKRANLLGHSQRAARLNELLPDLRLIAILRHPIERTVSGYFHYMSSGFIPIAPIERGLPKLMRGEYASDYPRAAEVIDFSMYGKHLTEYERVFSRDRLHVILLEDIKSDPHAVLQRLYQFVGVDPSHQPSSLGGRPMRATYSLTRLRLRQPLERLCRDPSSLRTAQSYRKGPLFTSLKAVNTLTDRLLWSRLFGAPAPKLSDSLTDDLVALFEEDVRRLEQLLGRSLEAWRRAPARF